MRVATKYLGPSGFLFWRKLDKKRQKPDVSFDYPRGGGKKRKKKNYTTPKKIKHKHKKVKLAVLKYYKVGTFYLNLETEY